MTVSDRLPRPTTGQSPPPRRFGFVVHPLTPTQLRFLGIRSGQARLVWTGRRGPAALKPSMVAQLSLRDAHGARVEGVLVATPLLPEELLSEQELGVAAVLDAVELCRRSGAEIVGLGAVSAVIGGQGKAVAAASSCPVTTGNGATAMAAVDTYARWRELAGEAGAVSVYGPPGPVANGILRALAANGLNIEVVTTGPAPGPLQRASQMLATEHGVDISLGQDPIASLRSGRTLIAASSTGGRLRRSALPPGAVVIDVAAPQDVILDGPPRRDVLILDGEYLRLPQPLSGSGWRWLYNLVTGQGRHIFACFAEPMLLALADAPELCSTGRDVPLSRIRAIAERASHHGMGVDGLFSEGRRVSEDKLRRFAERRCR